MNWLLQLREAHLRRQSGVGADRLAASPRVEVAFALLLCLSNAIGCARDPGDAARLQEEIVPLAPAGAPATVFPAPSRPVASIVTDTWSNEDSRDNVREAEQVMDLLDVRPGMTVADIGAGSGYYTVRLSRRVGPMGEVYAEDIVPEYLQRLGARVEREELGNVTLALGEPHDPRLPASSVDLALLVHMYHEIEQPYGLSYNLTSALRPGGRVAVVDLDRPTQRHGTPPALLRCEFGAVGFEQVGFHPLQGGGYLAIFEPPAPGNLPAPGAIRSCPTR